MSPDAGADSTGSRRQPSRPVSRPPRLRPTTQRPPRSHRSPTGPGPVLRSLSGALLAVAAVALGVVVLLALRGGGRDDALLATGEGAASPAPSDAGSPSPAVPSPSPSPFPAAAVAPPPVAPPPVPPPPVPEPPPPATSTPPPPVPADVTVTVLGVGGSDVAEPTARRLREEGWTVRLVASYRGDPPGATTLFHVEGREDAAARLAASAGAAAVRPAPASLSDSDLTLVVRE